MIKPSYNWKKLLVKCLLTCLLSGVGLWLIVISVIKTQEYQAVRSRTVYLEAEVFNVERHTDSEGMDNYWVYVKYTYNGKEYTTAYTRNGNESWLGRLGETVRVDVDSQNPTVRPDDIESGLTFAAIGGVLLLCVGLFPVMMHSRKSWVSANGLCVEAVQKDLHSRRARRCFWVPIMACATGFMAIGTYIAFYNGIGIALILLGAMCLPFGIILLVKYIPSVKETKTEAYQVNRYTVTDRTSEYDDEIRRYYLCIRSEDQDPKLQVSKAEYKHVAMGNELVKVHFSSRHWCDSLSYGYDRGKGYYDLS